MPRVAWFAPIYVAGWLVPASRRSEWRRRWTSNLTHWQVLMERGELPAGSGARFLRRAFADASYERFGSVRAQRFVSGPLFLMAVVAATVLGIGLCTRGFASTRRAIALAIDVRLHPSTNFRYDIRGDHLFVYFTPIVIAGLVGAALIVLKWRSLQSLGLRQWGLLAFEVSSAHLVGSLLWIEGGHALYRLLVYEGFRFALVGIGLAAGCIISFGFAMLWSIADLRRRCPVCLHRLILPVAMGSWASVFDPPATELVCSEGHGSMAVIEVDAEAGAPDRWTELDDSWQYLFPKDPE